MCDVVVEAQANVGCLDGSGAVHALRSYFHEPAVAQFEVEPECPGTKSWCAYFLFSDNARISLKHWHRLFQGLGIWSELHRGTTRNCKSTENDRSKVST